MSTDTLRVRIPEDLVRALRIPADELEQEVRKELAVAFYARGALSIGKASELADMSLRSFDELLGQREIERHYGEDELAEDIAYAEGDR